MKHYILNLFAVVAIAGLVSCGETRSTTGILETTGSYAAMADDYRTMSAQGRFLDPRSGQRLDITVDPLTGARFNARTGDPVFHYVDSRNWRVYGFSGQDWAKQNQAQIRDNQLMFRGNDGTWHTYNQHFPADSDANMKQIWREKYGTTEGYHSALSHDFRHYSTAGRYMDPRTGERINVFVDPESGARFNATTGQPLWNYLDTQDWNVYSWDGNGWNNTIKAETRDGRIMFRGDDNTWQNYDQRFPVREQGQMQQQWSNRYGARATMQGNIHQR